MSAMPRSATFSPVLIREDSCRFVDSLCSDNTRRRRASMSVRGFPAKDDLLLKDEVYAIVGAAMEVHRELRGGYFEAVYQEAMELELADRGIPFVPQAELRIRYKGRVP